MATLSAQFAELHESRDKQIFFMNYMQVEQKSSQIIATKPSVKAHEDRLRVAGLGTFQRKDEGTPVAFSDPVQGTRRRVVHDTFALGYRSSMEAVADDLWGVLDQMPADLGDSARDHQERLKFDLINDGFAGARNTGLDALPLFAVHTSLRPEVTDDGTLERLTNALAPPVQLSQTGLETMATLSMTTVSEEGRFIDQTQQTLVVHPEESHNAHVLLETTKVTGSADNDESTVSTSRTGMKVLVTPYKTTTRSWSVHDAPGKNSLQYNDRMSPRFTAAKDSDTFDQKKYGAYRASIMFSEWRGNWGSNFV